LEPKFFYGTTELAKELGWTPSKTHLYWQRGLIEEPGAFAGKRPLWDKTQVKRIRKGLVK
jgi:DNA-binding transcriptional MerR regulator